MHFEGLVFVGLPLVETGLAQGDAAGFGLAAFAAGGLEVDEIHLQILFGAWLISLSGKTIAMLTPFAQYDADIPVTQLAPPLA